MIRSRFVQRAVKRFDLDEAHIATLSTIIEALDAKIESATSAELVDRRAALDAERSELQTKVEAVGGDWVDLLARLTYGDRGAIEERLLADAIKISDDKVPPVPGADVHARLHAGNLELLKRAVVAWGGPGFCVKAEHPHDGACTPAPITEQVLDGLDETGERILEELQRRMVKPAKDFSTTPSQPSPTEAQAEPTAAG